MIYLDNAATGGFKPSAVQSAVLAAMRTCANPGRSGHRLSIAQAEHVLACRNLLSELFDGYGFERVVFTRSCTEALNLAILGTLKEGDHAVITALEHNSVIRPMEHLKATKGVRYDVVPLTETGGIDADMVASFVTDRTKLVAVTTASNVTGYCPDLKAIRAAIGEKVLLAADGAQGAGHIPISMKEMGIDLLAIAGHKGMHAIQGAAALLFSDRVDPEPVLFGGTGSESYSADMPAFYPDRLEAGTLSYPAICSLFEGALIGKARIKESAESLLSLTAMLKKAIGELNGYTPYFEANPCGIVSFRHERMASEEVATLLSERFDIAVRGGLHCAPLVHGALKTAPEGLVRASFSCFQGRREAIALIAALKAL